ILPVLYRMRDRNTLNAFIEALQIVIDRHDVLRTSVLWDSLSVPVQVVYRQARLPISWLEVSPEEDVQAKMQALSTPAHQWMDLTQGPLLRLQIAADPHSEQYYVLLQLHHIISDHVGLEIIRKEVMANEAGDVDHLPTPVPYREFVAHAHYQAKHTDAETFFRSLLGDVNEPTLPFNLRDIHRDGLQIEEVRAAVPDAVATRIRQVSKELMIS